MLKLIGHMLISGLVILSVTGLTVNLHYCGEDLYDIALNAPADSCCDKHSHDQECHPVEENDHSNHCNDEEIEVETTDVFVPSSFTIEFFDIPGIDLFTGVDHFTAYQGSGDKVPGRLLHFKKPPAVSGVLLAQIQSFLI
jgi:hypothetical protein